MESLIFYLPFLLLTVVMMVYVERKISAFIQNRLGPMEVGPKGILQSFADLIKMLQKEDLKPKEADTVPFLLAPILVFTFVFVGYSFLPINAEISSIPIESGLFFLIAIVSLDVIGIVMAGWSSRNKFAIIGAIRSGAQKISYEIPLGFSVLTVAILTQSLDLQTICHLQSIDNREPIHLLGVKAWDINGIEYGGFLIWNVVQHPLLFLSFFVFFVASLAQCNRTPFDLPESESELVGGYHTEYSGFRWGIFMLSEYAMMLLIAVLGSILFLGGWNSPFPNMGSVALCTWTNGFYWGIFWLIIKSYIWMMVQIWVRWTFPRLRVDQLMDFSWKFLTPMGIILVCVAGFWKIFL